MAWQKYTKNDLISMLSQEEALLYKQSFDNEETSNNVIEKLIESTTARIRGYLRKSNTVKMTADISLIPKSLFETCGVICRYDLLSRMPVEVTETRKYQYEQTIDFLKSIANNEFIPEGISDSEEEDTDSDSTSYAKPKTVFDKWVKLNNYYY